MTAPPAAIKAPAFYTRYTSAGGYPIVASAKVSDYALREAAYLVDMMLARRPEVREAMIRGGSRLCILGYNEYTTDLPEFAHLRPKDYWDVRARGTGGSPTDPYCSCGEENLLGYPGDPYATECILIHEFAHNIHLRGLFRVDPSFDRRVKAAYDAAMAKGLWRGKYAAVNHHEYFAEGAQSWFDTNRPPDHDHNHVRTREALIEYDSALAALCREVFSDAAPRYTRPATRLSGHLAGYDPSKAPRFAWPARLKQAQNDLQSRAVGSIRLVLPPQADAVLGNIARVFTRQVQSRCEAKIVTQGDAALTVEMAFVPGIAAEGFRIADGPPGRVCILASDRRGLLFGVGKFLHTSRYDQGGFTPSRWRGTSVPGMPVRGIYLATHFHNYYQVAPIEDVKRYVEDLSLWGVNSYLVWFGMEEFNGLSDPKAQAMLARLRALLSIVKDLGLNASLGCICNDGYANSPAHLRAEDSTVGRPAYSNAQGDRILNLGNELCPSKPGVPEMELGFCREKFDAFKTVGLDYWFIAPYDNGGCTCAQCAPWGINGYLRMAEPIARAYRQAFPKGKVVLSTWYFDRFARGEWAGLAERFNRKKPDWVDYIMADDFGDYPRYPLEHGVPGGLRLLNFPEISMWGHNPWGGYGANPLPERLQKRWDQTRHKLSGGFPYSEGIYEDLNKVICAQLYWSPERPARDAVRDYIAFEFSPEVVDEASHVVTIFEQNHFRDRVGESAATALRLVEQAETKLSPQARRSWRWRLFAIRATIDAEIHRNNQGQGRDDVFRQACAELTAISRAAEVHPMLRPVPIAAVILDGPKLRPGYAEAMVASKPLAWWRMNPQGPREITDATGGKHEAIAEEGVVLRRPLAETTGDGKAGEPRAAGFRGGRIRTSVPKLGDRYSVEFWLYNTMPVNARPITAYLVSRGPQGPTGTPADNLGLSGTSDPRTVAPGRLFFYNGDEKRMLVGKTELTPDAWHHIVLVRDGRQIAVYLNGRTTPEVSGQMDRLYPPGDTRLFLGGRNDNFANLQGRLAEAAVYDRALLADEIAKHYQAAGHKP